MPAPEFPLDVFDTSALVKRYYPERGTEIVRAASEDSGSVRVITDIALIELHSVFARHVRKKEITREDFHYIQSEMAQDLGDGGILRLEEVSAADKKQAVQLIRHHGPTRGLHALDALHLAAIRRIAPGCLRHVYCSDRVFIAILEAEGFTVINPEISAAASSL